jgi:hypothetical protein
LTCPLTTGWSPRLKLTVDDRLDGDGDDVVIDVTVAPLVGSRS